MVSVREVSDFREPRSRGPTGWRRRVEIALQAHIVCRKSFAVELSARWLEGHREIALASGYLTVVGPTLPDARVGSYSRHRQQSAGFSF